MYFDPYDNGNFIDAETDVIDGPVPEETVYNLDESNPWLRLLDSDYGAVILGGLVPFLIVGLFALFGLAAGL